MKKTSTLRIFIHVFLQSVFIIAIFLGVGTLSYKITTYYYKVTEDKKEDVSDEVIREIVDDVQIDRVSKNLIYHYNNDNQEMEHVILEIFNMDNSNLDYITIPVDTQLSLSNELYQRIYEHYPEVPQIIMISELGKYFTEKTKYAYGVLMLEDYLGIDISYYTILEDDNYNAVFQEEKEDIVENHIRRQVFSDSLNEKIVNMTRDDIESYIEQFYEWSTSNLSLKDKLWYADALLLVNKEYIRFRIVPGEQKGDHFVMTVEETKSLVAEIENSDKYTTAWEANQSINKASIGLQIRILNGSGITGLAASYKERLLQEGYTISGIANYVNSSQEVTRIIVREEGQGKDLLQFFKGASIEVGDISSTADIEIILGTADKIQ